MNKTGLIATVVVGVLLSVLVAAVSLKILVTVVKDEDITATEEIKVVVTETGEDVIITRMGTSSIKKLELEHGVIYFTDGWAVYVAK